MLELVKWSFTLPMAAIVLALAARAASGALQSLLKATNHPIVENRVRERLACHPRADIGQLRARTHAH